MQILDPQSIPKVFHSMQKSPARALIMGSIFLFIVSFILTVMMLLFYTYDASYGEAPLLSQAFQITAGQNIYKPSLQTPPFVIANYTPLYPLLIGASAIWAAGIWIFNPDRLISFLLIFHTTWIVAFSGLLFQVPLVRLWKKLPAMDALAQQVQAAAIKGPWLADDRLDMVVLAGQAIYCQPFEYTQLDTAGVWDITAFEEEIASQKFPLILIHPAYRQDRWSEPIYNTVQQNYTCILHTGMLVC